MPINDGVHLPLQDGHSRSEPERKPCVGVIVNDSGILAYLAEAMAKDGFAPHERQAYLACEDFKAFFNQFSLHTSERSRFYLTFLQHCNIYIASELVLGFK
jgi:hypothetical protein